MSEVTIMKTTHLFIKLLTDGVSPAHVQVFTLRRTIDIGHFDDDVCRHQAVAL